MKKEILKVNAEVIVFEDVSSKTGNPYRAARFKIGDYEPSWQVFVNNEQMYCLKNEIEKE